MIKGYLLVHRVRISIHQRVINHLLGNREIILIIILRLNIIIKNRFLSCIEIIVWKAYKIDNYIKILNKELLLIKDLKLVLLLKEEENKNRLIKKNYSYIKILI